jgi:hypothetical protein
LESERCFGDIEALVTRADACRPPAFFAWRKTAAISLAVLAGRAGARREARNNFPAMALGLHDAGLAEKQHCMCRL